VAKAKHKPASKTTPPKPALKPLTPVRTSKFKRDVKRLAAGGKDMAALRETITALVNRQPLEARHQDHPLSGKWKGSRDCHVEPDWVLIYRYSQNDLILEATGSHSDLFK
jgi:mRNA interferase YafQ